MTGKRRNRMWMTAQLLKSRLLRRSRYLPEMSTAAWTREVFYQGMVESAAQSLSVSLPPLYPVGGAANWSLLYGLFRIATESKVRSVLELGAGQSTLLLDAVAADRDLKITTLETDPLWAERIRNRVDTEVILCPLAEREIQGRKVLAYRDAPVLDVVYDCIVVDAPVGTKRYSRWASLEILERCLGEEFVVIFDDAERKGEQDTIKAFLGSNRARGASIHFVRGAKHQCYVFSGRFGEVAFL